MLVHSVKLYESAWEREWDSFRGNPPPSLCPHLQSEDSPGASWVWSRTWQVATCLMPPGRCLREREKLIRWLPSAAGAVPHQHRAERDSRFTPVFHRTRSIFRFFHITLTLFGVFLFVFFTDPDKLLRHGVRWLMNLLSLSLSSLFSQSSRLFLL